MTLYSMIHFQVVNLKFSEVQDRVMLTGRHMVRDVFCKSCDAKLGWIYEFAVEESQRYELYLCVYIGTNTIFNYFQTQLDPNGISFGCLLFQCIISTEYSSIRYQGLP